jgi:hypothetical protein
MTVYVDDARIPARVGRIRGRWSHLFADSQEELHAFAERLGLQRSWFQPGTPYGGVPSRHWHYDVTESKRTEAIRLGAVAVTMRDSVDIKRRRDGLPLLGKDTTGHGNSGTGGIHFPPAGD